MYKQNGHEIFVIDGHMHLWDASPDNWRNKNGEGWIKCFYDYHKGLSPAGELCPFEKFCKYGEETLIDDLSLNGYVDMGILNSTYLYEYYKNRSNSHRQNNATKQKYPHRYILCGAYD